MKRHAELGEVVGQDGGGEIGLLLVEIDGDEFEIDRRLFLQAQQDVQQGVGIFAPRQANHHPVAFFDHVVVDDGLAHAASEPLLHLALFVAGALCAASRGGDNLFVQGGSPRAGVAHDPDRGLARLLPGGAAVSGADSCPPSCRSLAVGGVGLGRVSGC